MSGNLQGAGGVGGLLMRQVTGGESLYYHYDANGNPARITNGASSNGTYRYDAFGNVRSAVGYLVNQLGKNPWQFSTKYHDPETGFSYYGYRYYDPVTGRWPSRDPIEETGGSNLYGFVYNEPNSWIDRWGLEPANYTNAFSPVSISGYNCGGLADGSFEWKTLDDVEDDIEEQGGRELESCDEECDECAHYTREISQISG